MSTHVCGCDPEHPWQCANFPNCAFGRVIAEPAMQERTQSMVRQMLEALIAAHGEEVVATGLGRVRDFLVDKKELKHPDVIAQDAVQDFITRHPLGSSRGPAHDSLTTAWKLTHGDRKSSYGDVRVAFARYAKVWSGLLGDKLTSDLTASDVALLMSSLKLAREFNKQQSDNVVDAHGYLVLHDEIKEAEADEQYRKVMGIEAGCANCGHVDSDLHTDADVVREGSD